jgi:hypothetical protein
MVMLVFDGPPLPVAAALGVLGLAAAALALRLAALVLRLVARAALVGLLLLALLTGFGVTLPTTPLPHAALALARQGAVAAYRAGVADRILMKAEEPP